MKERLKKDFLSSRKAQFFSIFYQVQFPIILDDIQSVLEFGGGNNTSKALIKHYNVSHLGVDFDDENYTPDIVSSILDFDSNEKFDIVCAFQVLEHNPLESINEHLIKMKSFSNKYIYISVPYSGRWFSLNLEMNFMPTKLGRWQKNIMVTWPRILKKVRPIEKYKLRADKYNPHWWEVGDKNLSKKDFSTLIENSGLKIVKSFHNEFFPYHLFYILEKKE